MKLLPDKRKKKEKETLDVYEVKVLDSTAAAAGPIEKLLINRLFLGLSVSLLVLGLSLVCVPHNTSVSLTEYVTVETVGLDGYGKAFAGADEAAVYKVLRERLGTTEQESEALREQIHTAVEDIRLSKTEGLANGETVSLCVQDDTKSLEAYWLNIHGKARDYQVSGLMDPFTLKLTDYLTASAEGVDGYGTLAWNLDEEKLKSELVRRVEPEGWKALTAEAWAQEAVRELKEKLVLTAENDGAILTGSGNVASVSVEGDILSCGVGFEPGSLSVDTTALVQGITLDVSSCVQIREEGYSGIGTVVPFLDEEAVKEKLADLLTAAGREEEIETVTGEVLEVLKEDLTLEADVKEGLTNQDTVNITAEGADALKLAASCGVVFGYGSVSFVIEDLTEPRDAVLTDLISVTFEGVCPNLEMTVEPKEAYADCVSNISLESGPLRAQRGDELLLSAEVDPAKALECGVTVREMQQTIPVAAAAYQYNPQEAEEELWENYLIPNYGEALEAIWKKSGIEEKTGTVRWEQSSLYPDRVLVLSLEKDSGSQNRVIFVYKGVLKTGGSLFGSKNEVFFAWMEDDLLLEAEGALTDTGDGLLLKHASGVLYSEAELNQYLEKQQNEMTLFSEAQTVRTELDVSKKGLQWFEENREELTEAGSEEAE